MGKFAVCASVLLFVVACGQKENATESGVVIDCSTEVFEVTVAEAADIEASGEELRIVGESDAGLAVRAKRCEGISVEVGNDDDVVVTTTTNTREDTRNEVRSTNYGKTFEQ